MGEFLPLGQVLNLEVYCKITEIAHIFGLPFTQFLYRFWQKMGMGTFISQNHRIPLVTVKTLTLG
jgi:hypothetical protein